MDKKLEGIVITVAKCCKVKVINGKNGQLLSLLFKAESINGVNSDLWFSVCKDMSKNKFLVGKTYTIQGNLESRENVKDGITRTFYNLKSTRIIK